MAFTFFDGFEATEFLQNNCNLAILSFLNSKTLLLAAPGTLACLPLGTWKSSTWGHLVTCLQAADQHRAPARLSLLGVNRREGARVCLGLGVSHCCLGVSVCLHIIYLWAQMEEPGRTPQGAHVCPACLWPQSHARLPVRLRLPAVS